MLTKIIVCIPPNTIMDENCPSMILRQVEDGDYNCSVDRKCGCDVEYFRLRKDDIYQFLKTNKKIWKIIPIE